LPSRHPPLHLLLLLTLPPPPTFNSLN
jgi:hypothetical protein